MIDILLQKKRRSYPFSVSILELSVSGHAKNTNICASVSSITRSIGIFLDEMKEYCGITLNIKSIIPGNISIYMESDISRVPHWLMAKIDGALLLFHYCIEILGEEKNSEICYRRTIEE